VWLEWGPLSLVSTIEELLGRNSSGFGLETNNTAVGIRHSDHVAHSIHKCWHCLRQQAAVIQLVWFARGLRPRSLFFVLVYILKWKWRGRFLALHSPLSYHHQWYPQLFYICTLQNSSVISLYWWRTEILFCNNKFKCPTWNIWLAAISWVFLCCVMPQPSSPVLMSADTHMHDTTYK
jgi:hypothetical protein